MERRAAWKPRKRARWPDYFRNSSLKSQPELKRLRCLAALALAWNSRRPARAELRLRLRQARSLLLELALAKNLQTQAALDSRQALAQDSLDSLRQQEACSRLVNLNRETSRHLVLRAN
jgi:hypothetical protein